ncbi:DUF2087 domain-containing protein [Phenylobacterium sp.]|uniref:DUF2087 domain-containing protein n=1 Tax=Phenylobacterium sp. TaxID=1871053 RepID=UPI00286E34C7|nr:DUF2087 domain-containing protein [Phenylobacterium sp.]
MSRTVIPLQTQDVSSFAKALRAQLLERTSAPSHVELLNMLARSAGRRNFQDLRALADQAPSDELEPKEVADLAAVERVARCFGPEGRLTRWPARRGDQILALWVLWSRLPAREEFTEKQISDRLRALHDFGDHALLRRDLVGLDLFSRTADCRAYRRIEQAPPVTAAVLISRVRTP